MIDYHKRNNILKINYISTNPITTGITANGSKYAKGLHRTREIPPNTTFSNKEAFLSDQTIDKNVDYQRRSELSYLPVPAGKR